MNVVITSRAEKHLSAMEPAVRVKINAVISSMEISLTSIPKKKLAGHRDLWRIREGDWRIMYREDKQSSTVYVIAVKLRKEVYR